MKRNVIKALVYDSKGFVEESFELANKGRIKFSYTSDKLNEFTARRAENYDTVVAFVNDTIDKHVIDTLVKQGKKAIFLRSSGFNNVDLNYVDGKLKIFRVPAYSPEAVAEHAFALIQTSNRRIHKAYIRTRDFNFSLDGLIGNNLNNKTIGIVGTGKIGRVMIDIANGFKMNVIAYDPYPVPNPTNFSYVSFPELLSRSDIISLHCPLTNETKYILNKDTLMKTKKGVMIVNTSRGGLIDSRALLDAIKSRHVSSACLDVYEEETNIFFEDKSNHILDDEVLRDLISMPNVIVTSHQGFLTHEALENIASTVISNITSFFDGTPRNENEISFNGVNKK
ncbi:MAG: 2-hydroxyacid dehydrogenase [Bacilli bacterium]|nr:2-hydroxyacid dehydrogenase [Bacilli bacterium]